MIAKRMALFAGITLIANSMSMVMPEVAADEPSSLGAALATLFSPERAPENRTMGLVQRNFLDLVEESKPKLQVAIVVDGTSSMEQSLVGIKETLSQMLNDISLYKSAEVGYQLVVFRDSGSPGGEVVFPMGTKRPIEDRESLHAAVSSIKPQSGAPFFHELIDVGVHAAITQVEWATDDDTTRWILVIADAPPFDVGFEDPESGARRRYETNFLTSLASTRGIKISCMLCESREEEREAYDAVVDHTRRFMNTLSTETGGLMLDLSYAEVRKALLASAKKPVARYVGIGKITRAEIDQLRQQAATSKSALASNQRVSLAVLPHMPLEQMSFDPDRPEVRVAADLRQRFRKISGVEVISSRNVKRRFERLRKTELSDGQTLQMLANALRVDYVVWGQVKSEDDFVQVSSGIFDRLDGKLVAKGTGARATLPETTTLVVRRVVNNVSQGPATPIKRAIVATMDRNPVQQQPWLVPVSNNGPVYDALTTGYEALEQATGFEVADDASADLLRKAEVAIRAAIKVDAREPLPHLLLASCLFNQAQIAKATGANSETEKLFDAARLSLREARRNRNQGSTNAALKLEIEADYALLVQNDAEAAAKHYRELSNVTGNEAVVSLHTALRAHWMLAGIYSGDWGATDSQDVQRAREHLRAILAFWPNSSQANYVKSRLRWNAQDGNRFQHLPQDKPLASAL